MFDISCASVDPTLRKQLFEWQVRYVSLWCGYDRNDEAMVKAYGEKVRIEAKSMRRAETQHLIRNYFGIKWDYPTLPRVQYRIT